MSIETFSPLPLNIFSTWVTLLDPSDVPIGMSPNLADVDFFPGGVRTRPGLVSQFPILAGAPQINALKTYITTNLAQRLLVLDSLGTLYKETSPGTLSTLIAGAAKPNLFFAAATHFGREYMAFADGSIGQDLPRQYDDLNYDRVSQIGPAEGPAVADSTTAGAISPGVHQCAVVFVTRQGFWTAPSPQISWNAAGSFQANITNIPTGPSNVVQRLLAFTGAGGANFYHVPATMVLNDNTTTSLTVDFSDTILLSGVSMDYLFSQIELPEQLGVVAYAERLFWWGERANMDNWRNLTFDGGWDASGSGRPLGWFQDPSFGAGGSREGSFVVWGDAYRITADGATVARGLISQNAILDASGNPLLANNTDYSVRARVCRTTGLSAGELRINAFSPTAGQIGAGLTVTVAQATTAYQEFTAQLFGPQTSLPTDLTLRVYTDATPAPSGESFLVDNIEIFLTNAAQNPSLVRACRTGLFLFNGGDPQKISQEIQPTWDAINWQYGQNLWVQVDTQHKRILVGVPMGSATQPNQILMLDYTEGFGDPLVAMLTAPERSRKWCPWMIAASCCGLIERANGVAQIFFGSNNSSGKIYQLTPGAYSDDGAAINSFYSTAFLAATGAALSGRNLFGYLTAYVQGSGTLALSAVTPGSAASLSLGSWTLGSPATRDMEQFTNVLAERVSYQFGTNSPGSWFSLTKLAPWAKPDPFAIVRGGN